jgi:flagellar basal-body rod modification protein FlgD
MVDPINGFSYYGQGEPNRSKSMLDMDTFMRLLTVQLANQNPLEPMNDRDFFAQMAQLGTVQGMDNLQSSMEMSQASGLLGKTVTAVRPMTDSGDVANSLVTGKVDKVTVRNGQVILTLTESNGGAVDVRLSNIREIKS